MAMGANGMQIFQIPSRCKWDWVQMTWAQTAMAWADMSTSDFSHQNIYPHLYYHHDLAIDAIVFS